MSELEKRLAIWLANALDGENAEQRKGYLKAKQDVQFILDRAGPPADPEPFEETESRHACMNDPSKVFVRRRR